MKGGVCMAVRPKSVTSCRCPYERYDLILLRRFIPDSATVRALREHGIRRLWQIVYARQR